MAHPRTNRYSHMHMHMHTHTQERSGQQCEIVARNTLLTIVVRANASLFKHTCQTCKHTQECTHTQMHSHIQTYVHIHSDELGINTQPCQTVAPNMWFKGYARASARPHNTTQAKHTQVCTHTHARMHARMPRRPHTWAHTSAHTHAYTETCTHTHAHIPTYTDIHDCAHTRTHKHAAAYSDATVSNCHVVQSLRESTRKTFQQADIQKHTRVHTHTHIRAHSHKRMDAHLAPLPPHSRTQHIHTQIHKRVQVHHCTHTLRCTHTCRHTCTCTHTNKMLKDTVSNCCTRHVVQSLC